MPKIGVSCFYRDTEFKLSCIICSWEEEAKGEENSSVWI